MEKGTTLSTYPQLIKYIWSYVRPYRLRFLLSTLLRLSGDTVFLYTTYALSQTIVLLGQYTAGASLGAFWFYFIAWAATHAYMVSTRQVAKYLCYWVSERVNLDVQSAAFRHLQAVDISWHEKENTGNKVKRVQNGGEGLRRLIRIWVDNILEIIVNFIGIILIVAVNDMITAGILVLFLITHLFVTTPLKRRASEASRVVNQLEEDYSGLAFEMTNNVRSVKVMGMFPVLYERLLAIDSKVLKAITKRIKRFRLTSWTQVMWSHLFRVIASVVIVFGIVQGRFEIAFFIMFSFYFSTLRMSVEELSEISQEMTIARYNIARLQGLLNEEILIDNDAGKIDFPKNWKTISLRNVSFGYGSHTVLKNITFDITRGEKIGIVGLSGAGKTTLFKLLLKEYEDFSGDILVDDISIRTIKRSSYFKVAAAVLQETEVFNFSLKDNIAIAHPDQKDNRKLLKKTLEIAHINDFLTKLPDGVETLIGEKGVKLSGGEKQRLGIARAVFKQPQILFLDEATSHLDLESEEKIKDSLHLFFKDVTAIVIAHRLTTIQEMDRILLIEGGKLLESGNFTSLYQTKGRFFDLWEKQRL